MPCQIGDRALKEISALAAYVSCGQSRAVGERLLDRSGIRKDVLRNGIAMREHPGLPDRVRIVRVKGFEQRRPVDRIGSPGGEGLIDDVVQDQLVLIFALAGSAGNIRRRCETRCGSAMHAEPR
jgi:hypothetical protein